MRTGSKLSDAKSASMTPRTVGNVFSDDRSPRGDEDSKVGARKKALPGKGSAKSSFLKSKAAPRGKTLAMASVGKNLKENRTDGERRRRDK